MAARVPRARDRATAAFVLLTLFASSFFFWLGIPLLVLWALSKATDSSVHHFVFGLMAVPLAMAAFAPVLFWMNGLYVRIVGTRPAEPVRGRRRPAQGPLETLLVLSLFISAAAALVWFFFFAENPPRQVI